MSNARRSGDVPYQLERPLLGQAEHHSFADVVHGAVIIEYERPHAFNGGRANAVLSHAKDQAEGYASRMAYEEGRPIIEYILVVWDGDHISFGETDGGHSEVLAPFDLSMALRLLRKIDESGTPLVHPGVLGALVEPESEIGAVLIPVLFQAVVESTRSATSGESKTTLLFKEWSRLFGQAVGVRTICRIS